MRERLIELLMQKGFGVEGVTIAADHLLANGVILPPCKVGDTVYMPWNFDGADGVAILTVTHIVLDSLHAYIKTDLTSDCDEYLVAYNRGRFSFDEIGKTVFLTREEAEQALKEREHQ